MSANIFAVLKGLLPDPPLLIGRVVELAADGCMIKLPSGEVLRARGAAAPGQNVFFCNGVIEGNAPNLAVVQIDI